jgi:hypothetical protein
MRGTELGKFRICQPLAAIRSLDLAFDGLEADRDGTGLRGG